MSNILASILSLLFFLFLRKLFADLVIKILHPLTNRTKTAYDNRVLSALKGPISFAFIIIGIKLFFSLLFLNNYTIKTAIYSMIIYNLFWAIYELTYAFREIIYKFTGKFNPNLSYEMGNFILTVIRGLILFIGVGAILQLWGINVAGLLAGLGIGGFGSSTSCQRYSCKSIRFNCTTT